MKPNVWDKYGKTIMAAAWAVATVVLAQMTGDGRVDTIEGIVIAVAVGDVILVYIVPLNPRFQAIKSVVNAAMAALATAHVLIGSGGWDGLDVNDWYQIIAAFLFALGVLVAPAITYPGTPEAVRVRTGLAA